MTEHDSAPEVDPDSVIRSAPVEPDGPLDVAREFSAFYRAFVPTLVGFLLFQGAQLADAAEIAQDTMMKAYRRWTAIDNPKAWSRRVASRELVRRMSSIEEPALLAPQDTALLPADLDVESWQQRHAVLAALAALPPRQRQVMAWTYDGYSPTEIAAELGIEPTAVRASLLKARRSLAAMLPTSEREDLG